ncbi:MAG: hypothetical protein LZF60_340173 [Nitrospira sp.]|nr:MAG: hypothetical protein LZF60_340173 [Nitrospira sp.]
MKRSGAYLGCLFYGFLNKLKWINRFDNLTLQSSITKRQFVNQVTALYASASPEPIVHLAFHKIHAALDPRLDDESEDERKVVQLMDYWVKPSLDLAKARCPSRYCYSAFKGGRRMRKNMACHVCRKQTLLLSCLLW